MHAPTAYTSSENQGLRGGVIDDDAAYFRLRAEQELERAQRATKPEVAAVHFALADLYRARLKPSPAQAPTTDADDNNAR